MVSKAASIKKLVQGGKLFCKLKLLTSLLIVVLWTGCFGAWVRHLTCRQVDPRIWTDCKLFYFLFYFGRHYSSMLLVMMSIEKCFAVYFPLKSKTVCTVKTAKWATGIVGVILAGYNSIQFFDKYSVFIKAYDRYACRFGFDFFKVIVILDAVDSSLYSFVPFILIFMTNSAIAFKFMAAKCQRNQGNSTESTNQALAEAATRGTAMVITVSVTFLLLTAPTAVNMTYGIFTQPANNPIYRAFMNVTQYLNHSINGILYCVVGRKFRSEFLKLICRKQKSEGTSTSCSPNNANVATISGSRT